jgi:squalene-hopene/tetraprenyl-beta-curcumene cyclase
VILAAWLVPGRAVAAEPKGKVGPSPEQWNQTVDRAVDFLRKTQASDGSWGGRDAIGITGIIVTGLLKTKKVGPRDPMVEKALRYIEGLVNPRAGHIAGSDPHVKLQNYVTCINVMALVEADRKSYQAVVRDAARFLSKLQWDEGEGKGPEDDFFGGAGYNSKSRPDMSNEQMFLDALKAAGISANDPAFKKAEAFVSRCQNLKGEHNDQPWAGKIDDGSFIYTPAAGGSTKVRDEPLPGGGLPGYGSMTYAGIKSLIYCGVSRDDPRIQKAYEWVRKHYTVKANPGMPPPRDKWGLFYYYHTMAKCLDVMGVDYIEDGKGVKHDWRAELTAELASRQLPGGSWINQDDHWKEGNPHLVTGYALMTLAYCKPGE